ncbi:MAG: chromosome segregation protein SMC [Phormidium sp. GEM2.Bin31]|nr:AAA family ATPase [Phormidium sp. BM_Day4_Bin.17]TVR11727.1 MAG: chromosome segregation protein SMC [Phormidium sp. GEM2.Bin31]UCJ11368.1 MAG: AAA family ATPase [Phormidium sp. PBR-2020]
MYIQRIKLKNWRNFTDLDVQLRERVFLIGPNACGKSNFLDVFRFLRDIADPDGGGLQRAVKERGGVLKLRSLYARRYPTIEIEVHLGADLSSPPQWIYSIGIKNLKGGDNPPILAWEKVWENNRIILNRPDKDDEEDVKLLTQTALEQLRFNREFREIQVFFQSTLYLHLVPQLLRYPDTFEGATLRADPFGKNFLERVIKTPDKTRKAWLSKIEDALKVAVPQMKQLTDIKDDMGHPHLEAVYEHWRPKAGKQREDQFSDGTLRLIALFWSLLETRNSILLLEEPELSLNAAIVAKLPAIIARLQKGKKSQVILSTHSADLLSDPGIDGREVVMMQPRKEGTEARVVSSIPEIRQLLEAGLTISETALPQTAPPNMQQLELELWS